MKSMLDKIGYPGMDVNPGNIDLFWLEGKSRITPRQQVDFLRRLYENKLPLKREVMNTVKAIMFNERTSEYRLSAKTGWAIRNGNNYGWFVGYFEKAGQVWFFATLVEPKDQENTADFAAARKEVTIEVWKELVK
jgi:beta-lactamase class D